MAGHGRPTSRAWVWLLCGLLAPLAAQADDAPNWLRAPMRKQLADVTFANADNGWAVGDQGAIWHTSDAGEHWQLQESGVDCRLSSVQFLDSRIGWAAGGRTQPYTQVSGGVLLYTRDGGQHWTHDRKLMLPALSTVKFCDRSHGWAVGRSSALFTSGIFNTDDGGRSWTSLPAGDSASWTAGDFIDPFSGALAGPLGGLATVRRRGMETSPHRQTSACAWHRLQLSGPAAQAWVVGDGAGSCAAKTWASRGKPPPANARQLPRPLRLPALAAQGEHCWIAGAPGTKVFPHRRWRQDMDGPSNGASAADS